MYNVEVSAGDFEVIYGGNGLLVHTNNYVSRHMRAVERDSEELIASRVRYNRALRLLRSKAGVLDQAAVRNVLADHVNFPQSTCNHVEISDYPLDRQQTIASLIMDLADNTLHVAWGTPCRATYHSYRLEV